PAPTTVEKSEDVRLRTVAPSKPEITAAAPPKAAMPAVRNKAAVDERSPADRPDGPGDVATTLEARKEVSKPQEKDGNNAPKDLKPTLSVERAKQEEAEKAAKQTAGRRFGGADKSD